MSQVKHKLFLFGLLGTALWVAVVAVQYGLANANSYAVGAWHQRWQKDLNQQLTQTNLAVAEHVTRDMLAWQANHPHYQVLAAKQVEWSNFYSLVISPDTANKSLLKKQNLLKAQQFYLRSAELRPTWPNTYVDLAKNALYRQASSQEAMAYLELAAKVGENAPVTLFAYVEIGLSLWPELSIEQRTTVAKALLKIEQHTFMHKGLSQAMKQPQFKQRACALYLLAGIDYVACANT
ncbi:exopolysaccharide biosynthesis protein VpsP [Agarivorans albus]